MPGILASHRVPGAVVSYIRNGDVAWTKAFGVADLQSGTPMRPDMVFNHGLNGKVMTAWAVMRLVEAGKVELDAPVNRYLKRWQLRSTRFDPNGVTPRRLLNHTAGLTVHGFLDYEQGAKLPGLVEVLEGKNHDDADLAALDRFVRESYAFFSMKATDWTAIIGAVMPRARAAGDETA